MSQLKIAHKKLNIEIAIALGLGLFAPGVYAACTPSGSTLTTDSTLYYCANTHTYDQITINTGTKQGKLSPLDGFGIYEQGTANLQNLTITTGGSGADGIRSLNNGIVNITGKLIMNINGATADGINANVRGATRVNITDAAEIYVKGGTGVRANVSNVSAASANIITLGQNATIKTQGLGANLNATTGYGVYAGNRDRETLALPQGFGQVIIKDGSSISTTNNKAYAVYANKTGQIQLGNTTITTAGTGAHGIVTQDGTVGKCPQGGLAELMCLSSGSGITNITPYQGGQVYLGGDTSVTVDPTLGSYAMYASGENSLITSGDLNGVQKSGEYKVTGNLVADRQGRIDLRAINASQFKGEIMADGANSSIKLNIADTGRYEGNIKTTDTATIEVTLSNSAYFAGNSDAGSDGQVSMTINGGSAVWQISNSSNLNKLNLVNGGQVILGDMATPADINNRVILDIQDLSGNGKFHVRADISRDGAVKPVFLPNEGDVIRIHGTAQGTHEIFVRDANLGSASVGTDGSEILRVVETLSDGATFKLAPEQPYVDVGPYQYILDKEENILAKQSAAGAEAAPTPFSTWAYWSLGAIPASTSLGGSGGGGGGTTTPPALTNTAQGSVSILNSNYLIGYVENQTLLQRMGELRAAGDDKADVWGRVYGGKINSFGDRRLSGFDMNYTGMQIGVDRQLASEKGIMHVGVMAGYTKGNPDYAIGSGSTTSYHVGFYDTYKAENGIYIDAIAKLSRMNNKLSTLTGGGYPVSGHGKTNGYSIGIEVGKRFYIQNQEQGWYIEPQAQMTHSHQGSATVVSSNGLRTDLDGYNSTIGRISVIGGYTITEGKNPVNIYFMTGLVKEFAGKTGYTFNHRARENFDFGGTWWENRIGINAQFKESHNVYLDTTYSKGSRFNHQQINLGYRYQF